MLYKYIHIYIHIHPIGLKLTNEGKSDNRLSIILSVAGKGSKVLKIDVPEIQGKFSGCGDLFTAVSGGEL